MFQRAVGWHQTKMPPHNPAFTNCLEYNSPNNIEIAKTGIKHAVL